MSVTERRVKAWGVPFVNSNLGRVGGLKLYTLKRRACLAMHAAIYFDILSFFFLLLFDSFLSRCPSLKTLYEAP